jgi:hypothetical protein
MPTRRPVQVTASTIATLPLEIGLRRRGYLRRPAAGADGA